MKCICTEVTGKNETLLVVISFKGNGGRSALHRAVQSQRVFPHVDEGGVGDQGPGVEAGPARLPARLGAPVRLQDASGRELAGGPLTQLLHAALVLAGEGGAPPGGREGRAHQLAHLLPRARRPLRLRRPLGVFVGRSGLRPLPAAPRSSPLARRCGGGGWERHRV